MVTSSISGDWSAWLLPYWADLHRESSFFDLAAELQAAALADSIAAEHPQKAAEIREWSSATRRAVLANLDREFRRRYSGKEIDFWQLRKQARELRCVAVRLVSWIELRLLEEGEMVSRELFLDESFVQMRAAQWREALRASGWQDL